MEMIYAIQVLLGLLFCGVNIDIMLSLSYDLGDVIKGRLNRNFFIKKVILGFFVFLICTFIGVLLAGKAAFILILSPVIFLMGLVSSLTGQKLKQSRTLDLIIYLIITRNRKSGK